jgi:hypothetical protein
VADAMIEAQKPNMTLLAMAHTADMLGCAARSP